MSVVDTINAVTDSVTGVVRLIVVVISVGASLFALFSYFAAERAIEEVGERAIEANIQSIEARKDQVRNAQLAKEGWGYDAGGDPNSGYADSSRRARDDWGADR